MDIKIESLWNNEEKASYTMYLMDNSLEIEADRKHPAIVICGGGGFVYISEKEKEPVALHFLNNGYQAFVLNYTTKSTGDGAYPTPLFDLAKMVLTIRENADKWNIDPDNIFLIGFSAGGGICGSLATQWNEAFLAKKLNTTSEKLRPTAAVLAYPLIDFYYQNKKAMEGINGDEIVEFKHEKMKKSDLIRMAIVAAVGEDTSSEALKEASPINHISKDTIPMFIWGTANDNMIFSNQLLMFAEQLGNNKIPYEIHVFENGKHASSISNYNSTPKGEDINTDIAMWLSMAMAFFNRHRK